MGQERFEIQNLILRIPYVEKYGKWGSVFWRGIDGGPRPGLNVIRTASPAINRVPPPHPPGLMFPAALQLRRQVQQQSLRPSLTNNSPSPESAVRTYVSGAPRGPATHPLKVWPFVLILLAGTGSYMFMVKSRTSETTDKKKARGPSITPR